MRLIVPFGRDGAADTVARLLAPALAERSGVTIAVEDAPGAGGVTGTAAAAHAADALLLGTSTTHCIAPLLQPTSGYDPLADFVPLRLLGWAPNVLAIHPSIPTHNVAQFIAFAAARPGRLRYASAGAGQTIHLCAELFCALAGLDMEHVPYPEGAEAAYPDLLAGRVHLMFDSVLHVLPHVRAGRLRALAVTGRQRSSVLPQAPTFAESALPDYAADIWLGLLASSAMPKDEVGKIEAVVAAAAQAIAPQLVALGLSLSSATGATFASAIAGNRRQWAGVLARCGYQTV